MIDLPSNIETERATLGSILMDRDAIGAIARTLKPHHFYHERHRWVYEAALACYECGTPPDLQTILEELRKHGRDVEVGGLAGLVELSSAVPFAGHAEYYAAPVKETAVLRRIIQAGSKIANIGYDQERPVVDVIADARAALAEAIEDATTSEAASMTEAIDELLADWRSDDAPGVMTGLSDLDRKTAGFQESDLIILAARTSGGKSSLMAQIAVNLGKRGESVMIFSHEMKKKPITQRFVCSQTGFDLQRMTLRNWSDRELSTLMECAGRTTELPIFIEDKGGRTPNTMRAQVMAHADRHGKPALIIVDYLQLMSSDKNYGDNRVAEVGDVSRRLKQLAMEMNTPILALAQLNRAIEHRANGTPVLADLRESGSIEQDADKVMFIVATDRLNEMEVHIAKNRNGPLGIVPVHFLASCGRWSNLETYRAVEGY